MSRMKTKKADLPAQAPHTLKKTNGILDIALVQYDAKNIEKLEHVSIKKCLEYIKSPANTWVNIQGLQDTDFIEQLASELKLHPLMLEDIMHTGQRSKLDDYKDTLFIVLRLLTYHPNQRKKIADEQVSIVLGDKFVLSFTENKNEFFNIIVQQLNIESTRVRKRHTDFLCYSLIDCIVDHYFVILEAVDQQVENLEEELVCKPTPKTLRRIQYKRREINALRKAIWPLREVINRLQRLDSPLVKETTKVYLQDVYDHTIQVIDTIESFREISSSLLDMYMSTMSQKLNEVMKVLTVVATLFVPLTFIASIYGMNFKYIPELEWKDGYFFVLGIMLIIAFGMLLYFRKKDWI